MMITISKKDHARSGQQSRSVSASSLFAVGILSLLFLGPVSAFSAGHRARMSSRTRVSSSCKGVCTRLRFRDSDDEDASGRLIDSSYRIPRQWLKSILPAAKETYDVGSSKQAVVDDYLEFLDSRYNRLHGDESSREVKFSAFKWLRNGADENKNVEATDQEKQDALYVLGVAGLASAKLLKKHQTRREQKPLMLASLPSVSVPSVDVAPLPRVTRVAMMSPLFARFASCLRSVSARRRLFVRYQSKKMVSAMHFVAKSAAAAPAKAAKSLLSLGGGRKNIAWTATVLAALTLFVLRHIVPAIIKEGVAIGNS